MQNGKWFFSGILLLLINARVFSQQLKLGKNPYVVTKSAVLELESSNQGLLFPRIADTSQINAFNPPDGMVIFHIPSLQLLLRSSGVWKPLTVSSALSNYWSTTGNAGTSSANFLGTTDLRHLYFRTNNVQAMFLDSAGNVAIGVSPIFSTAANREKLLVDAGGNITTPAASYNVISGKGYLNNYLQLNIQNRSPGTNASSDIVATADNGDESNNYVDLGINSSGNTANYFGGINDAYLYNLGQNFLIGTGTAAKSLIFLTGGGVQGTNERMRIDGTGKIGVGITAPTAFLHLKAGTSAANTAPLKFTTGPLMTTAEAGAIEFLTDKFYGTITSSAARKEFTLNEGILSTGQVPFANSAGRLTSLPAFTYTTNRLSPTYLTLAAGTATAGTAPLVMTAGVNLTTPITGAIEFNGTHFYGTIGSTRYVLDQQAGTIYTGSNGIALVGNDFRNTLFTGIAGDQTVTAGTAAGNSLILSSTSNATKGKINLGTSGYNEATNRLGLGNNSPTEVLDITGNLKFSGALMPGNNAGTAGYYLASAGAGTAPTWNAFDTTSITGFSQKVRALFSGSAPITYTNGLIGITQASTSTNGYLSSADWNTFNSKAAAYTSGNLTEIGSTILTITGGTNAVLGSGTSLQVKQASGSQSGFLSSTDWTTFNAKQGNLTFGDVTGGDFIITGGTGAVIGSGLSLALATTVNANPGIFGNTTALPQLTVNNKGLITAVSNLSIAFPVTSVNTATGAVSLGISSMNDATITTPATNQVLQYNGTKWINTTPSYISSAITSLNGLTASTQTFATPGTSGTAPIWSSTGSVHTLNIPLASAAGVTAGLLSNTDWTTFNNKLTTIDTTNITNFYIKSRSLLSAGTGIGYNNATGVISNAGVLSVNGNVGALTMDTGYISSFAQKTRGLFAGTAPITYANGVIGITQAGTSANGYLSSTDWNTFNSKAGTANVWSLTGNSGTTSGTNFIGTTGSQSLVMRTNSLQGLLLDSLGNVGIGSAPLFTVTPNREKFLVDAGTNAANNFVNVVSGKGSTNNYLQVNIQNRSAGTAASSDIVATNNLGTESSNYIDMGINSSGFASGTITGAPNTAYLFATGNDFVIGNQTAGRPLRFYTTAGAVSADAMLIDSAGRVGIANAAPTQKLDVTGNIRFSGALMPNNNAGTAGYFLSSTGAGTAPTWNAFDTTSITGFSQKVRSLFAGTAPITYSNGQIGITQATTATDGYLSSADWNTFNSKLGSISSGNLTETGSGVLTITGGSGAVLGSGTSVQVKQATTSQNGFLSSTDWNTFNNKLSTIDTTNISSFSAKVRSLFSGTAPITYANGLIGITEASTSTNGYLSSTDWNTFNNKASAANVWSLTGNSGTSSGTNFLGTTDLHHLYFRTNNVQGMLLDSLGNLGIGSSPSFTTGNREKLLVDAGTTNSFNVISGKGSINNYLQLNIQNKYAGAIASSDVVATADNGDETTNYIDMGINSSANTSNYFGGANDSYLYNLGQNFLIGTGTPAKSLVFLTGGGTQTTNERMRIDGSGNIGIGTNNPLNKLSIFGTNPLFLSGVQTGSLADSLVTISSGVIKKISVSSLSSLAVSSVGLSLPSIFSVSGSPVTTTGTLTGTLVVQPANRIFAGPASGADAVPTFRSLVAADLPIATPLTLGGISVGSGLAVTAGGILSATNTNGGTVTTVSATGTQGVLTSVTNATTTPAITIGLGAITPTSVAAAGTVTGTNLSGTNTGDQTIALTGDVTGSGAGSFTTTITPNAITYAKIQQAAANKLLGNPTGSLANVSEITLGSGLSFVGSALTYTPATSGTVTSVGLSLPSIFTVTNSPVTSAGTLTGALNAQTAKLIFAGPVSGSAVPTFRALAATDLPVATTTLVGGVSAGSGLSVNGSGVLSTTFNLASLSATAPVAYSNTTGVISLPKATAAADGYLSSADWTLFNAKLTTIDTSNITNFYIKSRSLLSAGSGISYNAGTGVISSSINTANFWALNGNTVTTAKNLGTVDNNDLPFITNNTEKMRLTATGFLGIGTSSPVTALHVVGTNPLTLMGVQLGANTDSILTIASGTVKKLPFSSLTSGTSWSLTGNSGTGSATNFLGTTDLQHLFFRTNNVQGMVLDSLGNLGVGLSPSFTASNREKLLVDAGTTSSFNVISGKGSINNYLQLNIQNKSAGTIASSDVVATADNGDETTNYVDMGINSSANTSNYFGNANDSYLYNIGQNFLIGTGSPSKNLLFLTGGGVQTTNERMRIDGSGNVGIGVTNAANPLVVKDVMEIRRVGTMSQLLFSNTASSGDFRIGGDGGDVFWQGGGGRSLQMGSFWGMVLSGDRQINSALPFVNGFTGTSVLVAAARDATVPLGIQGNSGTQTANLTEWRASSGSVFDVVDKSGNFGLGTTAPTSKLHVVGTNPLSLFGVQVGTSTSADSLLTITSGVVRKIPISSYLSSAITSLNGLTGSVQTFAVPGTSGTAPAWISSGTSHALNIPLASTTSVTAGLLSNTDWNTFNNKASTANVWSLTGNTGTSSSTNFLGTTDAQDMVFKTNNIERLRIVNGVSTSTGTAGDITFGNATSGTLRTNQELVMREDGDIYGSSALRLRNRNGENGAIFETVGGTANLVDFLFKTGAVASPIASNIRFETRSGSTIKVTGNSTEWQFGQPDATNGGPTLVIGASGTGSNSALTLGNFGIGNTNPSEKLDILGNVKFSGALMPNNLPGTLGYLLTSGGTGVAPTWTNPATLLAANAWSLTGNSGTTSGTNYIGTTGPQSLVIRTNAKQTMLLDSVGSVGIGDTLGFTAGVNREQFLVDAGTSAGNDYINVISGKGSSNNYMQVNIQNRSAGTIASSDIVASNNLGTESANFIDMGINSSGNTSTGVLGGNNTAYLYSTGADFSIGNSSANPLRFFTGGTLVGNERMRIDASGNIGIGTTAPTSKLHVVGTNPLSLFGVQVGTSTSADSLLTITSGVVRKIPISSYLSSAITSLNGLTGSVQTFAVPGTSGTAPAWVSSGTSHTLNIPLASTTGVTEGLLSNIDWNTFNNKANTANVWSLTGNTGSTSGSNFLGTIDNKSLVFRTFNTQAMLIDSVGSVGIGDAPIFTAGANREQLLVDAGISSANDFINVISGKASTNNYMQVNIQNRSSGTAASSDIVATNDLGTESVNFIDMGINSSGNSSTGVLGGINTAYLYSSGNDFSIGNASIKPLRFFTGGTAIGNERMRIDSSGNVGIANTAPTQKLDVTGNIRFSGSLIPAGSAPAGTFLTSNGPNVASAWVIPTVALNTISWGIAGNNGMSTSNYVGTSDNVGLYMRTKNIHRFYIDTLGNVAVGTGTSSSIPPAFAAAPNQEKFLVDGGSATPSYNLISGKGTINNYLQLNIQNKSTGAAASSDVVATNDAGTEANGINYVDMGVNGSGNTSTGVLGGANNAYLYATGTDFSIGNSGTGVLKLYTGTTEDMRIDVAGNVGIGTTTPSQKLDVNGNINVEGSIYADGNAVNTGTVSPGLVLGGAASGESISSKRTSGTNQYGIDFYTASNLRMTIYNAGNVGIGTGTTAPPDKLTVAGSVSPSANAAYNLGNSTDRWSQVYATNGTINTSDRREKTNIANLSYGLKEILALRPVTYNWKKTPTGDKMLGLIAQEVKEVVPEVVVGDESKEMLGMKYTELVPVLINAIKEQQKQIDELKQQVIKLQKKS